MVKSLVLAVVTAADALGAGSASAGVSWSIGINAPVVGAVVSGGPGCYAPACHPLRYRHAYAPAPFYRVAPPVAYYPAPIDYRPVPIVYLRPYPTGRGHRHRDGYGYR